MTKAVVLQDWMVPELSQPQMRMVRVPVLLRVGGPLSTTRMGRRNTSCSCRLKPTCCVCTAAVLSAWEKWAVRDSGLGQTPVQPHPDPTLRPASSQPQTTASPRIHTPVPLSPPILPKLLKILELPEPMGVLGCPRIQFPAVLSVFSSTLRVFIPSCAKVLSSANPRFCPQLGQGPGLSHANFFPH